MISRSRRWMAVMPLAWLALLLGGCCSQISGSVSSTKDARHVMTIVAIGDSTTAPRGPLVVYADLLRQELPDQIGPVTVINAGIGGDTTGKAARRFAADVLAQHPDVAIIQFGINDSTVDVRNGATKPPITLDEFKTNLQGFVRDLRSAGAKPILMTPNPMAWTPLMLSLYSKPPYRPDDPDGFNVTLKPYVEAVRHLAKREAVTLVDVNRAFYDDGHANGVGLNDLLLDGMHPNEKGHHLIAKLLVRAIEREIHAEH